MTPRERVNAFIDGLETMRDRNRARLFMFEALVQLVEETEAAAKAGLVAQLWGDHLADLQAGPLVVTEAA